jgi:hypothetical protein
MDGWIFDTVTLYKINLKGKGRYCVIHVSAELESFVMVICLMMTQPYNNVSDQNCSTIWTLQEKIIPPTIEQISTEQQQDICMPSVSFGAVI